MARALLFGFQPTFFLHFRVSIPQSLVYPALDLTTRDQRTTLDYSAAGLLVVFPGVLFAIFQLIRIFCHFGALWLVSCPASIDWR